MTEGLLGKVTETTLGIIAAILVGTFLVGGGKYLVLDYPEQLQHSEEELLRLRSFPDEFRTWIQVSEILTQGWFSKTENVTPVNTLLSGLARNANTSHVADFAAGDPLGLCTDSILKLTSERAHVAAYTFHESVYEAQRLAILDWYDREIDLLKEASTLIVAWEHLTPDQRTRQLAHIQEPALRVIAAGERVCSAEQYMVISTLTKNNADFRAAVERFSSESRLRLHKANLALAGVFVGLLFLALVFLGVLYRRLRPRAGSNDLKAKGNADQAPGGAGDR